MQLLNFTQNFSTGSFLAATKNGESTPLGLAGSVQTVLRVLTVSTVATVLAAKTFDHQRTSKNVTPNLEDEDLKLPYSTITA
jgi:hypothetical protein